jgi:ABC-2 type transport system ATP-binding protein
LDRWRVSLFGDRLHVIVDRDSGAERALRELLAREGVRVLSAREKRFSLEDVFISVVERARLEGKVATDDEAPT